MEAKEQMTLKLALETVSGVSAGLRADSILDQTERMLGQKLTTVFMQFRICLTGMRLFGKSVLSAESFQHLDAVKRADRFGAKRF